LQTLLIYYISVHAETFTFDIQVLLIKQQVCVMSIHCGKGLRQYVIFVFQIPGVHSGKTRDSSSLVDRYCVLV